VLILKNRVDLLTRGGLALARFFMKLVWIKVQKTEYSYNKTIFALLGGDDD
jgi:hypothetical protein